VHWLVHTLSLLLARLLLAPAVRLRVRGAEATARPGAFILVSNHISHFDPTTISVAARRRIDWMSMAELFAHPLVAAWLRAMDCFPVDRTRVDRAAVKAALDRLRRGRIVGLFPEAGIRDGPTSVLGGAAMRSGVGALAQLSGAPVTPCVIIGSDRLYAPRNWIPFRRTTIWIAFGEPMECPGQEKDAREEFETQIAARLRALCAELSREFGLTEADLPQAPARRKGRVGKRMTNDE
jgi:1-acyl-sn-glycerol-3-phosphate acyltransferase